MSDEPDKESKTESPTEKKISDAVQKGNVPFSRELVSLGSLLGLAALLSLSMGTTAITLTETLQGRFSSLESVSVQTSIDASSYLNDLLQEVLIALVPILFLTTIGGIVGSLVQNVPSATLDRVSPKFSRISPSQNIKRIIGKDALIEFAKTAAKFFVLCVLIYFALRKRLADLFNIGFGEPSQLPAVLLDLAQSLVTSTAVFVLLLAIVDVLWTRLKWWRDLMMTRQEQKDEHKSSEGDPIFKQKRRMIAIARSNNRMMADVPKATLVIVNPTHYAVALRYVPQEGGAPKVLAKGTDLVALKIRELCEINKIPMIENKPLARSLHKVCEVGEMIPPEFYKSVAEIIHFIERKRQLTANPRSRGASSF